MLRNDDGISLIGLLPTPAEAVEGAPTLADEAATIAPDLPVSDMLETAAFPAPEGWDAALSFGFEALKLLPSSKVSVSADKVSITAISRSDAEKRTLEADLARAKPEGLNVSINISAPRPVLTPFTLRFVKDAEGARFDACSADNERARTRILAAGVAAGVEGKAPCTIGLGRADPKLGRGGRGGDSRCRRTGRRVHHVFRCGCDPACRPGNPAGHFRQGGGRIADGPARGVLAEIDAAAQTGGQPAGPGGIHRHACQRWSGAIARTADRPEAARRG